MVMLPPTAMPRSLRVLVVPHPDEAAGNGRAPADATRRAAGTRRSTRFAWLMRRRELETQPETR